MALRHYFVLWCVRADNIRVVGRDGGLERAQEGDSVRNLSWEGVWDGLCSKCSEGELLDYYEIILRGGMVAKLFYCRAVWERMTGGSGGQIALIV
jgi:hypothetical protein